MNNSILEELMILLNCSSNNIVACVYNLQYENTELNLELRKYEEEIRYIEHSHREEIYDLMERQNDHYR